MAKAAVAAASIFDIERQYLARGLTCVGADEVGRGCLAGPVVAASVVFPRALAEEIAAADFSQKRPRKFDENQWWRWVTDSKALSPQARELLSALILERCLTQIAWADPAEIDRINILHASMKAMRESLWPFAGVAQVVLVDGHLSPYAPLFKVPAEESKRLGFNEVVTLVKGDSKSLSIAAASIVAKVFRDNWMVELDEVVPGYGFKGHKGYPTPEHKAAIAKLGVSRVHRLSFEMS